MFSLIVLYFVMKWFFLLLFFKVILNCIDCGTEEFQTITEKELPIKNYLVKFEFNQDKKSHNFWLSGDIEEWSVFVSLNNYYHNYLTCFLTVS